VEGREYCASAGGPPEDDPTAPVTVKQITAPGHEPAAYRWDMPPTPPRSARGASWRSHPAASVLPAGPRAAQAATPATLKILVAGVDKDERAPVEAAVRQALGSRAASAPWAVSLVKLASKWSVTLNGPGDRFRNLSFTADGARLSDAIREVVDGDHRGPSTGRPTPDAEPAPSGEARDRHACEHCRQGVIVVYESRPDEGKELAPLACPHCWRISHVEIGAWAASGGDYRAEKA
jgi:hypothetical protein